MLHGTPYVFFDREDDYYEFRKRIAEHFGIAFHEIFITGSAKLGFSAHKFKDFDYESDVDVAIVSPKLFDQFLDWTQNYQMNLREARNAVTAKEIQMYHEFLEYVAIGWIRPDKLPYSFRIGSIKESWFNFFQSISYSNSEIGNYKVSGGVFKSYAHLEKYTLSGLMKIKKRLDIRKE